MWRFKPFSHTGTLKELENGKVLLENWFQQLKLQTTKWRVPQNIRWSLPKTAHIQLELDHTAVWYMQGVKEKAKTLDYYPIVEDIFWELARQSGTKLLIPAKAKDETLAIEEPLTDQEKEEYYELWLHISTFVLEETPVEDTTRLQITMIPPTTQKENTQIEQQVTNPAEKSVCPTQQQGGEKGPEDDMETKKPRVFYN